MENSDGVAWIRGQKLGEGGFGSVYSAIRRSIPGDDGDNTLPSEFAVKSAEISKSRSLRSEKEILCHLNSSFPVVHCYGDEITVSSDGELFYNVLMEKCGGGSLRNRIWNSGGVGLPEDEVRVIAHDILKGLSYVHSRGFLHCDIKPENILLDFSCHSFCAKICDFGLAKKVQAPYADRQCSRLRGTVRYMSPELLENNILSGFSDIWAVGCVVIEMMTGKAVWGSQPSEVTDNIALKKRIVYRPDLMGIPTDISINKLDFLVRCLDRDPKRRWTASMLLKHPFIWNG